MTTLKSPKTIGARSLGQLFQLELDGKAAALVLYKSGVERLAELIGKLSGATVELERKKAKVEKKPAKAAKAEKKSKTKRPSRPVTEATAPESTDEQDPPRVQAGV